MRPPREPASGAKSAEVPRLARRIAVLPIRFYQRCLSPFIPPSCRFSPTCSQYALEALLGHGLLRGGWLAVRRVARCHPFGGGGWDPVPEPRRRGSKKPADPDAPPPGEGGSGAGASSRYPPAPP